MVDAMQSFLILWIASEKHFGQGTHVQLSGHHAVKSTALFNCCYSMHSMKSVPEGLSLAPYFEPELPAGGSDVSAALQPLAARNYVFSCPAPNSKSYGQLCIPRRWFSRRCCLC